MVEGNYSNTYDFDYNRLIMNHLGQITNLMCRPEDEGQKLSSLLLMVTLLEAYIPEDVRTKDYSASINSFWKPNENPTFVRIFQRLKITVDLLSKKGYLTNITIDDARI